MSEFKLYDRFGKVEGYDYMCKVAPATPTHIKLLMAEWVKTLGPEDYATLQINAHFAIYFKHEDDAIAFKLRFICG